MASNDFTMPLPESSMDFDLDETGEDICETSNSSTDNIDNSKIQLIEHPVTEKLSPYTIESRFLKEFRLGQCLGSGAEGSVFHAEGVLDEANYAIKIIPLPSAEIVHGTIVKEVKILATLEHKNIVRYFGGWTEVQDKDFLNGLYVLLKTSNSRRLQGSSSESCQFQGSPANGFNLDETLRFYSEAKDLTTATYLFIQQSLCIETLSDWLRRIDNASLILQKHPYVLLIFSQVIEAVEYIHSKNIIHRDLKPANIFFGPNNMEVKIGDFGFATFIRGLDNGPFKTLSPNVGTDFYLSPEITTSDYDCKTDIYSLGIVFYELCVPFSTTMERCVELSNLRDQDFSLINDKMNPKEAGLLKEMLAYNPANRPDASSVLSSIRPMIMDRASKLKLSGF